MTYAASRIAALVAALLTLPACAAIGLDEGFGPFKERGAGEDGEACQADDVRAYVGQRVSENIGARILAESGAQQLRWGPPGSAWTMDYLPDRVNVRYDGDGVILAITCG
ncbi:I78 family peptidase inhibitor [Erythrobacter sp.]|jgi:hypothetical protein|uniref:I78 family peptidase inhibitor n=1 Tax=Erythrobacter sp. TaxID=1042 RepID=UPI002EC78A6A|nr:I78 family peptidase inhibitor [Erythrobacter sp.]